MVACLLCGQTRSECRTNEWFGWDALGRCEARTAYRSTHSRSKAAAESDWRWRPSPVSGERVAPSEPTVNPSPVNFSQIGVTLRARLSVNRPEVPPRCPRPQTSPRSASGPAPAHGRVLIWLIFIFLLLIFGGYEALASNVPPAVKAGLSPVTVLVYVDDCSNACGPSVLAVPVFRHHRLHSERSGKPNILAGNVNFQPVTLRGTNAKCIPFSTAYMTLVRLPRNLGTLSHPQEFQFTCFYSGASTPAIHKHYFDLHHSIFLRFVNCPIGGDESYAPQDYLGAKLRDKGRSCNIRLFRRRGGCFSCLPGLFSNRQQREQYRPGCYSLGPSKESIPTWQVPLGVLLAFIAIFCRGRWGDRPRGDLLTFFGALLAGALILLGYVDSAPEENYHPEKVFQPMPILEHRENVSQKHLTYTFYL